MLDVRGLQARAGAFTLHDVSLDVPSGQCHAVLGPSGSGKTTLLRAILGAAPLLAGRVRLGGDDVTEWPMERRRMGYVPQTLGLFPHLSVRENLAYSARARGHRLSEADPHVSRLVEVTGIAPLLGRYPGTLSGGERQRVALVRALVADPRIVLLDEPFAALNETLRRELWWLLDGLRHERGLTVVLITHDLSEAYVLAAQITVLIAGCAQQQGARESVYRRPATEGVARFLGIKNLFPAQVTRPDAVDCAPLGGALRVAGPLLAGDCLVGIRSEHVALRVPGEPPRPDEALLQGRYEAVLDLGESAHLRFLAATGATLEIKVGARVARKLALRVGTDGVVGLPAQDLFVVPVA